MIELRRGMIVDVNLDPTLGSETGKTRPAIVMTNDQYNRRVPVVQVVPMTGWSRKKGEIRTNAWHEWSYWNPCYHLVEGGLKDGLSVPRPG